MLRMILCALSAMIGVEMLPAAPAEKSRLGFGGGAGADGG